MDARRSWWDRTAWAYDVQARFERPALDSAVVLARVGSRDRVLDAGCGTGQWLRRLAATGATPARLVGADRSDRMLHRARGQGAELVEADVCALPFADESFDVVCLAYVLHVLADSDMATAISEARRVLAQGGRLVTVTPWPGVGLRGRAWSAVAARSSDARWHAMMGFRPLDPTALLVDAGFAIVATVDIARGYRSRCICAVAGDRPGHPGSTSTPFQNAV